MIEYSADVQRFISQPANWLTIAETFNATHNRPFAHAFLNYEQLDWLTTMPITPMLLSNYGFADSYKVQFTKPKQKIMLTLNRASQQLYDRLLDTKEMPIVDFAQTVAKIVNDSMAYQFSRVLNEHAINGMKSDVEYYVAAQKTYAPPPNPSMHGICSDSGDMIRAIIKHCGVEYPNCLHTQTQLATTAQASRRRHDITILFSDKNWIAINSLSPTNPKYVLDASDLEGKTLKHGSMVLEPREARF